MRDQLIAAIRGLRHRRGVAATVVLTLTLGIGANSAIFSTVDAVLLKPLPYPAADRLVAVYELNLGQKHATQLVAPGRIEEWHRANRLFDGLAGSYFENMTETTGSLPERVEAMRTSPRFFSVLGVPAALGRTLTAAEELMGGPRSVVISDGFWRSRFNADPAVIGRTLVLSGASRTVVGVMPPSFRYPTATTEAWVPAQMPAMLLQARQARFLTAIGRLKPGVTVEQAQADLTAIQARLGEQFPDTDKGWGASLSPLKEEQVGGVRRSLWFLAGAVALVLLAACGNVACLLLAEAARREHELAVRFALGASRTTVVRQLLIEGLVLALIGSALGLVVAEWGTALLRQAAATLPRVQDVRVDARLVAFTIGLGLLTTVLFAIAPALQAARTNPAGALGRGGRGHAGGRHAVQRVLVAAQVAMAIVLLVGAGLLIRSFTRLQAASPGFDAEGVQTFRMSASWSERLDAVIARQRRTVSRLEEIPGVEAAAISQALPAGADFPPGEFRVVGGRTDEHTFAQARSVSAGYFKTLHIPILSGGTCNGPQTGALASEVLVTRAFAERFFPGVDPIGHSLSSAGGPPGAGARIVGLVADVHENGVQKSAEPLIYWCGYSGYWPDPHFLVRLRPGRPASFAEIRAALREIEPTRAVYAVRTLTGTLSESTSQQRLNTLLLALFAVVALALAAMGLYGVLSQLVAGRRREIGVRMALGARAGQILGSVVAQAATVTGAGIVVGLASAFALTRFMTTLLFGIAAVDPLTFAAVPVLLAVVALAAALIPARRAASVDPIRALRED
jgi:putative ABC transport system permease protein